jgi:hypothetical protein
MNVPVILGPTDLAHPQASPTGEARPVKLCNAPCSSTILDSVAPGGQARWTSMRASGWVKMETSPHGQLQTHAPQQTARCSRLPGILGRDRLPMKRLGGMTDAAGETSSRGSAAAWPVVCGRSARGRVKVADTG